MSSAATHPLVMSEEFQCNEDVTVSVPVRERGDSIAPVLIEQSAQKVNANSSSNLQNGTRVDICKPPGRAACKYRCGRFATRLSHSITPPASTSSSSTWSALQ